MNENELKNLLEILPKIVHSAGIGGYLVDMHGDLCFDGDLVRVDFSVCWQTVRLCYSKTFRRWYFVLQESEWIPVDNSDFTKIEEDEK